jgi:undecaprenyl-diphosphatase
VAFRRLRAHPLAVRVRAVDRAVDAAVSRAGNPCLDAVFYPLSSAADHSLLWLATAGIREARGRARPGTAVRLAVVLGVESAVTNLALKSLFGRIRPALDPALTGPPPWYLLAGLVAFSRVYVRLHHTSDVVAGAVLGLTFGLAARRFAPPATLVRPGNAG